MNILTPKSPVGAYRVITASGSAYLLEIRADETLITRFPESTAPADGFTVVVTDPQDGLTARVDDFSFQMGMPGLVTGEFRVATTLVVAIDKL